MAWGPIEPTAAHLSLVVLSAFLVAYALFSQLIRNRLHLSEPPLATLLGILLGPSATGMLTPMAWGLGDSFTQEFTRVVLGVQCFSVGVDLPRNFLRAEWRTLATLLGPVMAAGWLVSAALARLVLGADWPAALVLAACLTPTDPVLAASIFSNSRFAERVPARLRRILAAESGCNDGTAFPFLYAGLALLTASSAAEGVSGWLLGTVVWQCACGTLVGCAVGAAALPALRRADARGWIAVESFLVFYLLLALLCVGLASTLGLDDFLVAFAAGAVFARDGWFAARTAESRLPGVVDLQLNSAIFIYFGARIPWSAFRADSGLPHLTLGRLAAFTALVLVLRRLPAVLALKPLMPGIRTWREALFAGHFGPMGVGAMFLATEGRARLETGTSVPLPEPPRDLPPASQQAVDLVWPAVCFVVLGSTVVHGLSTLAISVVGHFSRKEGERAPLLGQETDTLEGMESD